MFATLKQQNTMGKRTFAPGDRVTRSVLGRERTPKAKWQSGTIIKVVGRQCYVLFDGNKRPTILHETYLHLLPADD